MRADEIKETKKRYDLIRADDRYDQYQTSEDMRRVKDVWGEWNNRTKIMNRVKRIKKGTVRIKTNK